MLDEVRTAIRQGRFDSREQAPRKVSPITFREFAEIYKERHALAKRLSLARTVDWRIRPLLERFGDWALTDIKTANIEDFITDLRKPRIVAKRAEDRAQVQVGAQPASLPPEGGSHESAHHDVTTASATRR